jgi:isoaspartyl peptidase/L-asparaginase-like protein (Ntn-hydrolase superfamily)
MKRRDFLKDVAGAALAASLVRGRAKAAPAATSTERPVVIATWDYGLELVQKAQSLLVAGAPLLDALEKGVNVVEDDPKVTSVGYGGIPNEDGVVQLDAAIFDGRTHRAGAVAALERIKNPISVARKVMERTEHVMLVGAGANQFARKLGFVEQDLLTPESKAKWEKLKESFWRDNHDTVCALGLDAHGDLASAVSTSGLGRKLAGRVGDSPILGAGSYVDNDVGAAAATGVGELTMRTCASFAIVERMRAGQSPQAAVDETLRWVMHKCPELERNPKLQLAFIALDKQGRTGAAVTRADGKKPFRYALARGSTSPALHDVKPLLS